MSCAAKIIATKDVNCKLPLDIKLKIYEIAGYFNINFNFENRSDYEEILGISNYGIWSDISSYKYLTLDFIRFFANKINWETVVFHTSFPDDFIIEFAEKFNWGNLSQYQKLSKGFISMYKDKVVWKKISQYQVLDESFIMEFTDYLDWVAISKYQQLSETFIEEFIDRVDWFNVSIFQKLSVGFVAKHADKFKWQALDHKEQKDLRKSIVDLMGSYHNMIEYYNKLPSLYKSEVNSNAKND